jgi:DNA-binding MarR family transcriptional regulator
MPRVKPEPDTGARFHDEMMSLIRSLGLHKADQTPCGEPVSVGDAHALFEIAREAGITQNGLAQRLSVDKSTASRIAASLERRGWLRRTRDRSDSRRVLLSLTTAGTRANQRIAASRKARFERIFDAIPSEQRDAVQTSLNILVEVIRAT